MTEAVERRFYLPADWSDEVVPPMLESPDAYLWADGSGKWQLRLAEGDPDYENEFYRIDLEPGQIVNWFLCEQYGYRILTVRSDRTWSLDRLIPEKANKFWVPFDPDTACDTLEQLVATAENPLHDVPLPPGPHGIEACHWSEPFPMRFEVTDGSARFTAIEGSVLADHNCAENMSWHLHVQHFGDTNIKYVDISATCSECGRKAMFRGPAGLSPAHPTTAIDGSEVVAPFLFEGEEYDGKGAGYSVSVKGAN